MISGYLLTLSAFRWPLLIGGAVKAVYDLTLLGVPEGQTAGGGEGAFALITV